MKKSVKHKPARALKKVVVLTGATGKLGRVVAQKFVKQGYSLRLIVRPESASALGGLAAKASVFLSDLSDPASKEILVQACRGADDVVHVAGLVDLSPGREAVWRANVESTRNLIEAAKVGGVRRFILCSSTSVLRNSRELPIDESSQAGAHSDYGESKIEAERLVKESKLPYIILRPTMIYGPSFSEQFKPVLKGILKGKMRMVGSGANRMAIVHEEDVAQAFVDAVESTAKNEVFIISNGPGMTQEKSMGIVAKAMGVNPPTKKIPLYLAIAASRLHGFHAKIRGKKPSLDVDSIKLMAMDRWYSSGKARKLLGWRPEVDPEKGLGQMARAWLAKEKAR